MMTFTSFHVPPGKADRLPEFYFFSHRTNALELFDDPTNSAWCAEPLTSDQVTPEQRAGSELFFGSHSSWGFGMAVDFHRAQIFHTLGRFGWTGGFGTTAYVDPAEGIIGILFTQRMMESPEPPKVFTDFWTLANGAME